jgi:hypothetical protein
MGVGPNPGSHRHNRPSHFDDIRHAPAVLAQDVQAKQTIARCKRHASHGRNLADTAKKICGDPPEVLFDPLVLDWRGDSLRLVN